MPQGLQLKIGADISDAQAALKTVVSDSQAAASKVSSAFGRIQLPLQNITQYNAAINSLKQNIGSVKFSLPELPELNTDINIDTSKATGALKSLTSEAQATGAKVISIFATPLPTTGINNYSNSVTALKQNINSVSFSNLQEVPPLKITIDTNAATQSIIRLQSSIDVLKTRAAGTTKLLSVETDIAKADQLRNEISLINAEITDLSNRGKTLSAISFGNLNLPLNNINQYNQSITALKQNIGSVILRPLPDLKLNVDTQTGIANLKAAGVPVEVLQNQLLRLKAIASQPLNADQLLRVSGLIQKTQNELSSLAAPKDIKLNLDTRSALSEAGKAATDISSVFTNLKIPLPVLPKGIGSEVKIDTSQVDNALKAVAVDAQNTSAKVISIFGSTALPAPNTQAYTAAINSLQQAVGSANITPAFDASNLSLEEAIKKLDNFHRTLSNTVDPASVKLYESAISSLEAHIAKLSTVNLGNLTNIKPTVDFSGIENAAVPATSSVAKLVASIESLRAQATDKLQLLSVETDEANILRLNKDIEGLLAEIKRLGDSATSISGLQSSFSGLNIPLDNIKQYNAGILAIKENIGSVKFAALPPLPSPPKIKIDADVSGAQASLIALTGELNKFESQGKLSIGGIEDALKQFKQILSTTTDPKDISKLNSAIGALKTKLSDLKSTGVDKSLHGISTGTRMASSSLLNLSRSFDVLPPQVSHVAHSFDQLFNVYEQIRSESTSTGSALKKFGALLSGPVGLGLAVSVGVSLLAQFGAKMFEASEKTKLAEEAAKKYKEAISGVFSETAKEATQVATLVGVLKSETETRERRLGAIKELQKIQPEIFAGLKLEGDTVIGLDSAYQNYIKNLSNVIAVKIKQLQLERLITKQLESQGATLTKTQTDFIDKLKKQNDSLATSLKTKVDFSGKDIANQNILLESQRLQNKQKKEELSTEQDIAELIKEIGQLSKGGVKLDIAKADDKKALENIISKAKEVADFLKDAFVITYQFSPLDSKEVALAKAQKFLNEVSSGDLKLLARIETTFSEPPDATQIIKDATTPFEDLQKKGIIIPVRIEADSGFINDDVIKLLEEFEKKFELLGGSLFNIPDIDFFKLDRGDLEKLLASFAQIQKNAEAAAAAAALINGVLTPAFDNLFNTIKSGENPLKAFFQGLGQAVLQLIQKLIQAAITAAILAAIIPGGAGTAGGFGAIFGKLFGFAGGGLVTGPTLAMIGEGSGTSLSNPEAIIPLDQLKSMLSDLNVGHRQFSVAVTGRLRGRDMLLQNVRTSNSQRRLGA